MIMLTYLTDLPVSVYSFNGENVKVAYNSGYVLAFSYQYFIEHIEELICLPFLDALNIPCSIFHGRDEPN